MLPDANQPAPLPFIHPGQHERHQVVQRRQFFNGIIKRFVCVESVNAFRIPSPAWTDNADVDLSECFYSRLDKRLALFHAG